MLPGPVPPPVAGAAVGVAAAEPPDVTVTLIGIVPFAVDAAVPVGVAVAADVGVAVAVDVGVAVAVPVGVAVVVAVPAGAVANALDGALKPTRAIAATADNAPAARPDRPIAWTVRRLILHDRSKLRSHFSVIGHQPPRAQHERSLSVSRIVFLFP